MQPPSVARKLTDTWDVGVAVSPATCRQEKTKRAFSATSRYSPSSQEGGSPGMSKRQAPPTLTSACIAEKSAASAPNLVEWDRLVELGPRPRWVLDTERGRVVVELAADQAPLTVQRLTDLARAGRFDGVPFHRVVPNFVAQGGDLSRGPDEGPPPPL